MLLLAFAALCIGISKAGFSGVSLIAVFILADTYGAKESLGIALPLLIAADLIVYPAFRKYGSWKQAAILFPPALVGMGVGFYFLQDLPNEIMRPVIGSIILAMASLQLIRTFADAMVQKISHSPIFSNSAATMGGIATVLANAAGPVFQLYFLSINMKKMELIGVCARFFLVVNILKVPFNAELKLITPDTLLTNLYLLPFLALGIFTGKKILHRVPQHLFAHLVLAAAILAGVKLTFM